MNEKFLYNFQNTKICLQNVEKYKIVEEGINCPSDLPKKCINYLCIKADNICPISHFEIVN